jgi:hemerythrin superfamily protein
MPVTNPATDIVALIRQQHESVRTLMESIMASPSDRREDGFASLRRLLAVHETAEEMTVYPAIRKMGDRGTQVADARTAEEDEAKKVLARLEGMDTASDEFTQAFMSFRADVEAHAEAEETEVFPLLMESDEEGRAKMGEAFELAEKMAPTHAHRMAPEGAVANLLVGPFVAMVDKVRDAISHRRAS